MFANLKSKEAKRDLIKRIVEDILLVLLGFFLAYLFKLITGN